MNYRICQILGDLQPGGGGFGMGPAAWCLGYEEFDVGLLTVEEVGGWRRL